MEKEYYTCEFCQTNFIPKRRKVQKFCSNSCRSKSFHHRNKKQSEELPKKDLRQLLEEMNSKKTEIETMSLPGVGNAAAGAATYDLILKLLTSKKNTNATKQDIQILTDDIRQMINLINKRYFLIHNMNPRHDGALPHFDMGTCKLIYLADPNFVNPSNYTI